jgi:hypothetical protein
MGACRMQELERQILEKQCRARLAACPSAFVTFSTRLAQARVIVHASYIDTLPEPSTAHQHCQWKPLPHHYVCQPHA